MIIVHHLGVSQSERVVWLCEELAIPYTLRRYDRDPKTNLAPAEYKALHPMEIAPVITDGDLALAESGAILEYLIAKYGNGRLAVAANQANFADYLFWFHFANGTVMPSEMGRVIAIMLGVKEDNPVLAIFKAPQRAGIRNDREAARRRSLPRRKRIDGGRHHDVISAVHSANPRAAGSFAAASHQGLPRAHRRAAGLPARHVKG